MSNEHELAQRVCDAAEVLNTAIEAFARTGLRVIVSTTKSNTEGIEGQTFVATFCAVAVETQPPIFPDRVTWAPADAQLRLADYVPFYPLPATAEEKAAVRKAVQRARSRGEFPTQPEDCELCRSSGCRLYAHHTDYSKPLEVRWVCTQCHALIHSYAKDIPNPL